MFKFSWPIFCSINEVSAITVIIIIIVVIVIVLLFSLSLSYYYYYFKTNSEAPEYKSFHLLLIAKRLSSLAFSVND